VVVSGKGKGAKVLGIRGRYVCQKKHPREQKRSKRKRLKKGKNWRRDENICEARLPCKKKKNSWVQSFFCWRKRKSDEKGGL